MVACNLFTFCAWLCVLQTVTAKGRPGTDEPLLKPQGIKPVANTDPRQPVGQAGIGQYSDKDFETPFTEHNEEWDDLLEKVADILEDIADAIKDSLPTSSSTRIKPSTITHITVSTSTSIVGGNSGGPISALEHISESLIPVTITSVFDPSIPSQACNAWDSLLAYCSGSNASCVCYSSSYYVPQQFESLAGRCASYGETCAGSTGLCGDAKAAHSFTGYCENVRDLPTTAFGAVTTTATTTKEAETTSTPKSKASTVAPKATAGSPSAAVGTFVVNTTFSTAVAILLGLGMVCFL